MRNRKLVYGIGINDVDYNVTWYISPGVQKHCPYFSRWKDMLKRCYSEGFRAKKPWYEGCTVCNSWLRLSTFKVWMETQEWQGLELDKDVLNLGNKHYSPENCVFIPKYVNLLATTGSGSRNTLPLGVKLTNLNYSRPYEARVRDGLGGAVILGSFTQPILAHRAWQYFKIGAIHNVMNRYLSEKSFDQRVADSFYTRIRKLKKDLLEDKITESL